MAPLSEDTGHLSTFVDKMQAEALPQIVIDTFSHYYRQIVSGEKGMISDSEIEPVETEELPQFKDLEKFESRGQQALPRSVRVVLNGGLGTSMGLTGPKSLLKVKDNLSFLEIILQQTEAAGVRMALMNSFNTQEATKDALSGLPPEKMPEMFCQHKFPKVLQSDLSPASWPQNPKLEWNPPGHGDIYTALYTSGMLDRLIEEGIDYAFISNSDNLGAVTDIRLLGYFAEKQFPFMMEVAQRTPADKKGGHIARHQNGRLLLREIAQCPDEDQGAFQDIGRHRFFNTNNLWINLHYLKHLIDTQHTVRLPIIVNPKTLDPRDAESPPVYQIETAMGAAISLFENAAAVEVPDDRFCPVKKCNELLAVRSDCYFFGKNRQLRMNQKRTLGRIRIDLDPAYYGRIDLFEARFPQGPPSLVHCESLKVMGDVHFEGGVTLKGTVTIENRADFQAVLEAGAVIEGEKIFA